MNSSYRVLCAFLHRDVYILRKHLGMHALNVCILGPTFSAFIFGYLQPRILVAHMPHNLGAIMAVGSILIALLEMSFRPALAFILDLRGDRFVEYQTVLVRPYLVIFERIIFSSLVTFVMACPFFVVVKLLLGSEFDTSATSWPLVILMLFFSSLMIAAYHILAACLITTDDGTERLWMRFNVPLLALGGFVLPWYIMYGAVPWLGYLDLLNPMLYITEGLRRALFGSPNFFAVTPCVIMLLTFTAIFTYAAIVRFKQRIDHV